MMQIDKITRIDELEMQVITLKIAVQKITKIIYEMQESICKDSHENSMLYNEITKLRSDLLLEPHDIHEYANQVKFSIERSPSFANQITELYLKTQ